MTTTDSDKSRHQTVAELFLAAGLVSPSSGAPRTPSRTRWRGPSLVVATLLVLASVIAVAVH
ncbi:MAG: hypothetical protein KGL23_06170 [Acidobacteriota bacterium]|nr:hypothetical protein [Acidobacteriota bacterium]MDE3031338.1 hypothetical protein [Acidobacteriota bacterium]MDE3092718.1 hypothetical protein [Acidobacteriota bacterium]MDE3139346.1 hypothetical protein [Acidobacteriota bacterium]MDE3146999.1 hypothetical protein [Acidobacteriota bacterium]